mmetsp:Transcript_19739/g.34702  ORF Transcript_19739/g.34702 Transcript_19739/m.34702 type:complete len:94 (-) Transcript_19739:689-970(-)
MFHLVAALIKFEGSSHQKLQTSAGLIHSQPGSPASISSSRETLSLETSFVTSSKELDSGDVFKVTGVSVVYLLATSFPSSNPAGGFLHRLYLR